MSVSVLVAALAAVTVVAAGPALSTADKGALQCAAYCKQETDKISKFKYSPGTTYQYRYESLTRTHVAGASQEASRLHVSARADITALTHCDFALKLRDVELFESRPDDVDARQAANGHEEFKRQLEAHPLQFSFQDGVVDELCPSQGDPVWVLNIKRGVLSTFQNAMPDFRIDSSVYETDVTGTCETHYVHGGVQDDNLLMTKTKNLLACSHRMDHYLSVQSTHYSPNSPATNALPLLKSDHTCEYALSYSGHLRSARCSETHLFRPFSSGESGARTDVTQTLSLVQTSTPNEDGDDSPRGTTPAFARRTTLLFEHDEPHPQPGTSSLEAVTATLAGLATRTQDGVDKEAAAMFARLVADLRALKLTEMAKLFDQTEDLRQRRFLLDALPLVSTAESLETMLALWKSEQITSQEMDSWLSAIPFQARAKPGMITALLPLLDGLPRPKALLAVSALVHRVCEGLTDCAAEVTEVAVVVSRLERLLGADCRALGRDETDMVLLALRALGNAGVVTSPVTLARCYESTSNPLEVRLAALTAWRRAACEVQPSSAFLKLYTEQRFDVELRIAAYLAAMRCPSPSTLRVVKDTLYAEDVNQVASFVWTHLTNLQETASPWKQSLRELVESDFLKNKFKTDARKFSRNYEGSLFFDKINAGVTTESNVVFSPQSYLPRSANLNLTVDIFGESVNLFEMGARVEGFESVVEGLFAKGGAFPDEGVQAMLQNLRTAPGPNSDAENSIAKLSNAFDVRRRLPQEPHGEMYARVFGNELHYSRFHGLQELAENADSIAHPMRTLLTLLRRSEVDVTRSFVFLDAAYVLPTVSGMPLELTANGSATLGLQIRGRLDLSELMTKRAALMEGRVAPSAALQVVANMGVNAHVTRTGLRTVSTLHSSTYLDGKIRVDGAKLVEVSLAVPRERVDVVEVTSKLYLLHRDQPRELAGIVEDREETSGCTSNMAATITGFELCSSLEYANGSRFDDAPYFPLTGPFNFSVGLRRTDQFDSYNFLYKLEHDKTADPTSPVSWSATFDTPGSRVNRKLHGLLWVDARQLGARAHFTSPWAALEASAKANLARDKRSLDLTVNKDGRELLAVAASCVQTSAAAGQAGSRLEPTMTVAWRRRPLFDMRGAVSYVTNQKYSADLTVGGLTEKPVTLAADLTRNSNKWELSASARASDLGLEAGMQGSARWAPPSVISAKLTANYKLGATEAQDVALSVKYQSSDKGALSRKSAAFNLQMTQWPQYNLVASLDAQRADRYWESSQQMGLGDTIWSAQQLYRNRHPNDHNDLAFKLTLACPKKAVDYRVDLQHLTTDTSLSSHALLQYSRSVRWNAQLEYGVSTRAVDGIAMASYRLNAQLACPWRVLDFKADVAQQSRGKYRASAHGRYEVSVPRGPKVHHELVMNGSYVDNSTSVSLNHVLELDASFPKSSAWWSAPFRVTGALAAANGRSRQWLQLDRAGAAYRVDVDYTKNRHHVMDVVARLDTKGYKGRVAVLNEATEKGVTIDLQFSKRFVLDTKISCDGEKHVVSVEMFWDKDVDPSKRVALHAEADSESNQAELAFPDQYIKLHVTKLPNGFTSVLEWTEGDRITLSTEWALAAESGKVSARLTTPFHGYKLQTLAALYILADNRTDAGMDLTWRDQMLSMNVLGETLEGGLRASAHVTSSLALLRDVTLSVSHADVKNGTLRDMRSRASLDYNGHLTAADAVLLATNIGVTGTASFVSPFELARSLSGKFTLENDVYGDRGQVEVSWAPERRAGAEFELMMGRNPHVLVQIATPFEDYELTMAEFLYRTTADLSAVDIRGEFNRKTASLSLEGQRSGDVLKGKAEITSPFTESVKVTAEHNTVKGKVGDAFLVAYAGKGVVELDVGGDVRFPELVDVTGKFSLPGHRIEAAILSQVDKVGLTTELSGKWNQDSVSLRVEGSLHKKEDVTLFDHKLVLSGSVLPRELVLVVHHQFNPDVFYTTRVALPGSIFISHSLTMEDKTHWENSLTVKTPTKSGSIVNSHSMTYDGSELEHTMTATLDGKKASASFFSSRYSAGYIKNLETVITTPFTEPIKLTFDLPFDSKTTCRPKLVLNYKNKTISAVSLVRFNHQGAHFNLQFDAPFCAPVRVDADVDFQSSPKKAHMVVKWEGKEMEVDASGEMSKLKSGFSVKMNRPDLGLESFRGEGNYDFMAPIKSAGLDLNINGQEWFVKGRAGSPINKYHASIKYQLPISEWESINLVGDIDLTKPSKLAVVKFDRKNSHLILSSSAFINKNAPRLSLSLDSNIPGINSATFLAAYNRDDVNAHTIEISYGHSDFSVKLSGNLTTNDLAGVANIELLSPIEDHERMSLNFDYNLKGEHQKVVFKATRNDWAVLFDGMSNLDEKGEGEAMLQLNMPYEGLEDLMASLKQEVGKDTRSVNLMLTNKDNAVSLSGNVVTPDDGGVAIVALLITPFEGFESIGGHLNVTSPQLQKKWASVSLHRNQYQFNASGQMNVQRLKSSGSIAVTTPLEGYKGFDSEFDYDVSGDAKQGRAVYSPVGGSPNLMEFSAKTAGPMNGQAKAEITLPVLGMPQINVDGQFDCRSASKFAEFEVLLNKREKMMSAKIEMERNKLKAWFVTPKDGFKDVFVSGTITSENDKRVVLVQVKNSNADSNLTIEANLQKYVSDVTVDVSTPYDEWQSINLAAKYDLVSTKKLAMFKLARNGLNIIDASAHAIVELVAGEADIKLATSFLDFSSLAYKGSYDFTDGYSAGVSRERDGETESLTGRVSLQDDGANVHVQTPYEGYEDVTLAGRYAGGDAKTAEFSLETNGKKRSFEISISNKDQVAKIDMKTPVKDFEKVMVVLNYSGLLKRSKAYSVDLAIEANEKTFLHAGGVLNLNWDSKITLNAEINIPLLGGYFDDLSIDFVVLPGLPPRMVRLILKNRQTLTLEAKSDIFNTYNGGFTFTSYAYMRNGENKKIKLEFYPREILMRGSVVAEDKVILSSEFLFNSADNKVNVDVKTPFESYEHVGLGWQHGKNFAQAWMKTPIQELEDLKAYGEFNVNEANNSSIKLSGSRNDNIFDLDILIRYSYENGDSHIAVKTSLKNYEKCSLAVKYDMKNPRKSATIQMERNDNIHSVSGDVLVSGLLGDAIVNVRTPYDGYKDVRLEGNYDFNTRGHKKVTIVGDFEDERRVNARFGFAYAGSRSSVEIISETPFTFATFSVVGEYDYIAPTSTWNIKSAVKMAGVSAEVNSLIVRNKEGNLVVAYNTPNEAKKVKVDWQLENGLKHKKAAFAVDMGEGKRIETVASMYLDGFKTVETEVTITNLNSQTYSLTAQWNMARSNVIAGNIGLQWGEGKEIKLIGDLEIGESKKPVKLGLTLISPFRNLENVKFSSVVTYENELILTSELEWDPTKKIVLNSLFSHSVLQTKSKVEFTTPFTEPLLFTLKQDHAGLLEALFQLGSDKYELKGNVAQYSFKHLELDFTLTTPQQGLTLLKLHGMYSLEGAEKLAKASFTKERETAAIHIAFKAEKKQHSARLALTALDGHQWEVSGLLDRTKGLIGSGLVQWNEKERIDVDVNWVPSQLSFESKTPFKGFRELRAGYMIEFGASSKKGKISGKKEGDEFDLNFNVDLSNRDEVTFDVGLKTPFTEYVSASGTYRENDGHHVVMIVKDKRKQTKVEGKLRYEKKGNQVDMHFESSKDEYKGLDIRAGYNPNGANGNKQMHLNMRVGETTLKSRVEAALRNDTIYAFFRVDSSIPSIKSLEAGVNLHKSQTGSLRGNLNYLRNDALYQIHGTGHHKQGKIRSQITVEMPGKKIDDVFVIALYDSKSVSLVVGTKANKFEFEGVYDLVGPIYSVNATLKSPFISVFEHLALRSVVDAEKVTAYFLGQWTPENKVVAQANLRSNRLFVKLQTPFKRWETVEIAGQYSRNDLAVYELESKANWNEFEINLTGSLNSEPSDFGVKGQLEWSGNKKIDLDATVQVVGGENLNNIKCKFRLYTPFKQMNRMELDFALDMSNKGQLKSRLALVTPFQMLPELRSTLVLRNDDYRQMSGLIEATALGREMRVGANISNDSLQNVNLKLQVLIPFLEIPPITIEGSLNQREWRSVDSEIKVMLPKTTYHVGGNYRLEGLNLAAKCILKTPAIQTELAFGGNLDYENLDKVKAEAYFGTNNISVNYELKDTSVTGSISLIVPAFKIKAASVELQGSYSPHIEAFLSYNCHRHSGSVRLSMEHKSDSVSTRVDLELPDWLGPTRRTLQVSLKYPGNSYVALITLESQHKHSLSVSLLNDEDKLEVRGHANSPIVGEKNAEMKLSKNWETLMVNLNDVLFADKNKNLGSVTLKHKSMTHRIQYLVDETKGMGGSVEIESPLIKAQKLSVNGNFIQEKNRVFAEVDCILGTANHRGSLTLAIAEDGRSSTTKLEVVSVGELIVGLLFEGSYDNINANAELSVQVKNAENRLTLRHKRTLPLDSKLVVVTPLIGPKAFQAVLTTDTDSILAYAGTGNDVTEHFVLLEAALKRELGQAHLNFKAPLVPFIRLLTMNGEFVVKDARNIKMNMGVDFQSDYAHLQLLSLFTLNSTELVTKLGLETPIEGLESLQASARIPLVLTKDMDVHVKASLPSGATYAAHALFQNLADRLEMSIGAQCKTRKLGGAFKLVYGPVYALEAEVNTPFQPYKHYRLDLKGQKSLIDGNDIVNYVEWNEQRIELRYSMLAASRKFDTSVQLTTPFASYERYALSLKIENNNRKTLSIKISHPQLRQDLIVEFDYTFNGMSNVNLLARVVADIHPSFESASLLFGNKLNAANRSYAGILLARYNDEELSFSAEGMLKPGMVMSEIQANVNSKQLYFQAKGGVVDELIEVSLQLETPFEVIRDAEIFLQASNKNLIGTEARIVHNTHEYLGISVRRDDANVTTFEARNSWRPVSASYLFNVAPEVNLIGEVCWDMNAKEEAMIRYVLHVSNWTDPRKELTSRLQVPTRTMTLSSVLETSAPRIEFGTDLSIERDQVYGVSLVVNREWQDEPVPDLKYRARAILRLPQRTLEVSRYGEISFNGVELSVKRSGTEFLWDAARDRDKKFLLLVVRDAGESEFRLHHAALEHDLVLRYKQGQHKVRAEVEYSSQPEDMIVVEGQYKDGEGRLLAALSVRHDASDVDLRISVHGANDADKSTGAVNIKYLDSRTGQDRVLEVRGDLQHTQPAVEASVFTNENKIVVNGKLWARGNGPYRGVSAGVQMNQRDPLTITAHLNAVDDSPSINVDVQYGDSRTYAVFAGMPNHREIKASAQHNLFGTQTIDGLFTMKLNTSKLFWTRASWRPGVLDELQNTVLRDYNDLLHASSAIYEGFTDFLREDVGNKWERVYPRVMTTLEEMIEYNNEQHRAIREDLPNILSKLKEHFEHNDFFVKDIWDFFTSTASMASSGASCVTKHTLELLDATYSAVKGFTSIIADILYVDISGVLDVIPVIKALGHNAMLHWNSTMSDLAQLRNATHQWTREVLLSAHDTLAHLEVSVARQMNAWDGFVEDAKWRVQRAVLPALMSAQDVIVYLNYHVTQIQEYVSAFVESVKTHLLSMEEVREFLSLYSQYASWLEDFHVNDYIDQWLAEVSDTAEWIIRDLRQTYSDYKAYWDALYDAAFGHYEALSELPPAVYVRKVTGKLYQKLVWAWRYYDTTKEIGETLQWLLHQIEVGIMDLLNHMDARSASSPTLEPSSNLILDKEIGLFEYTQTLPVHWHGFDRLPEFQELSPYRVAQEQTPDISSLDKYRFYLLDALNEYRSGIKLSRWLPPYGATALLVGRHHFMTFDKQFYDFAGECSYLLTSDFVNSKFSAIVNYEINNRKVLKKSLTVLSDGHSIEVTANHRILVDGKKAETPVLVGDSTSVTRQGDRVRVTSTHGLTVDCNLRYDLCSLDITGWHFGRTGGLLGTYDNEPANDLALPTGELTGPDNLEGFADAWRVGRKQCRPVNHAEATVKQADRGLAREAQELCASYFLDSDSSLAPCFPRVDPTPFRALCEADVKQQANSPARDRALCAPAAAYVEMCQRAGMELWVPQFCVRCDLPDGNVLAAGEVKVFKGTAPQSADVVFVVEQAACLRDIPVEELALKLDVALKRQGLTGNRYAVVGFGGDDEETFRAPHTRSTDGQMWITGRHLEKAFNGLSTSARDPSPNPMQDAYDAIWYAARLPFRAGVSKTIVLVACHECSGDASVQADVFSDAVEMLKDGDFSLHVLEPRAVRLRKAKSMAKVSAKAAAKAKVKEGRIFGADRQGVFTPRNVKTLQPSDQLKQVTMSKDLCTPLALETNGTVFNLDRVSNVALGDGPAIPVLNKRFLDVWSRRVAAHAQPANCQRCDCVADQDGSGRAICQNCLSPSIAEFLKEWDEMTGSDEYEDVEGEMDFPEYSDEDTDMTKI